MKALMEDADTREEEDSSSVEEREPSYDDDNSYDTETQPTPRSPAAQQESSCDEDLNTGTPPTSTSPASSETLQVMRTWPPWSWRHPTQRNLKWGDH